jgi:hypothetical protein
VCFITFMHMDASAGARLVSGCWVQIFFCGFTNANPTRVLFFSANALVFFNG